jgi:hypothetical protein
VTTIRVHHDIGDLADDMASIVRRVRPDMRGVVKDGIRVGRDLARANAKRTAGAHGKHYPKAITAEMGTGISGEYGPDSALPQGGMSFEHGSRNQPPHNDLAKSADVVGPSFLRSVDDRVGEWFW